MKKIIIYTFFILAFLIGTIFGVDSADAGIPVPTSQQIYSYPAIEFPVLSDNPAEAKPIGVGSVAIGGNTVNIRVGLNQVSDYVDVYFAIAVPKITPEVFILTSNSELKPLSEVGLVPWKQNILGPINESLFGDIPLSLLPPGTYYIYLVVTPTGRLDSYYLWITYFRQPPVTITFPYCGDEEINIFEGETCDTYPEPPIFGDSNDLRQCRAPGTIGECTYCGDAIKDAEVGEECDDGDSINDNDCRNDCTLPRCGDGILDPNEECDDGNNVDGDGCSANCKVEQECVNIAGTWRAKFYSLVTLSLSQDQCEISGIHQVEGPDPECGYCQYPTLYFTGSVDGNIFTFTVEAPWQDCETCELICYDTVNVALTVMGNTMKGTMSSVDCEDGTPYTDPVELVRE